MEMLKNLQHIITDIIMLCDMNYNIVESNRAADILLGKGESITGQQCYKVLKNSNSACNSCPLKTTLESGKILPYSYFDNNLNEHFEERLFPVTNDSGTPTNFVLVCRNISDTKAIENQSSQMKKLSALGKISSGVAHDFNNILTVIKGRIHLMKMNCQDQEIQRNLEIIQKAANDGAEKIRGIQEFARHKNEEEKTQIDLEYLIKQTLEITEPKWKNGSINKGIMIEPVVSLQSGIKIEGIESDLRNGFTNIIFNAVDAMPDGGIIKISSTTMNNFAILTFQDTGIGMTEEVKEKVFDPFYSTKGEKGTGMGMSEVYGIVKRHNGLIDIESMVGFGTKITFKLPLVQQNDEEKNAEEAHSKSAIKIMSVSKNEFHQNLIQEISSSYDVNLLLFDNFETAIENFKIHLPEILLTNLELPKMEGLKLAVAAKHIKQNTINVLLPEILIPNDETNQYASSFDFIINPPQTVDKIKLHLAQIVNSVK